MRHSPPPSPPSPLRRRLSRRAFERRCARLIAVAVAAAALCGRSLLGALLDQPPSPSAPSVLSARSSRRRSFARLRSARRPRRHSLRRPFARQRSVRRPRRRSVRRLLLGSALRASLATAFGNLLAALCRSPSAPLSASAICSAAVGKPLRRRSVCRPSLDSALRAVLAAALSFGHGLGSALRATLAAALCVGHSLGSALRAAPAAAVCVGHLLTALCAPTSPPLLASAIARQRSACRPRRRLGRRPWAWQRFARCLRRSSWRRQLLGSAMHAALAAARRRPFAWQRSARRSRRCSRLRRFTRQPFAHRPRRRSRQQQPLGSALRAALAAALGVGHRSAVLYAPPLPPRSASAVRSAALCTPPSPPFSASAINSAALCTPPSPPLSASAIRIAD